MKQTKARSERGLRFSDIELEALRDFRKGACRHEHEGLLKLLVMGVAAGKWTLRGIEGFADQLSARALRSLGLKRAPSDTTLYRVLAEQSLHGFALVLVEQVKKALLRKWIGNDLYEEGVVAIDGKAAWSGVKKAHPRCRTQVTAGKPPHHVLMAQRACLVSSSARPVVTQRLIAADAGEADTFGQTFEFLMRHFRRSFEVVTHDAGGTSRENARLVNEAGKTYLFAVKGNQPGVHKAAMSRLGCKEAPNDADQCSEVFTEERVDGGRLRREVFLGAVDTDDPEVDFSGARLLVRVRQSMTRRLPSGREETTVEDRYFVTNRRLPAMSALKLVRLHWGIENGPNWTCDVVLREDDGAPCQSGNGIVVTSWLRLIAYNLLSLWRHRLPPVRDEKAPTWNRAIETFRNIWVAASGPLPTLV